MAKIGEKIKEARLQNGWSQEELAKRMGYKSKSTINKIETGINDVTQSKVAKFAQVLNVSIKELMGWLEEPVEFQGDYSWLQPKLAETLSKIATDENMMRHIDMLIHLSDQKTNDIYDQIQYWYDKENQE